MPERFVIEKVVLLSESEGPDYFTSGEFQVTDKSSGRVVARFPWSLEEAYMANAGYSGPDEVRISDDGTEAVATGGDAEERVLLPTDWREIIFDGVPIAAGSDIAALARRIAIDDGPADPVSGHRQPGGQWLWKLHKRLGETPLASRLRTAIAALLEDPDPRARTSALQFYYFLPDVSGVERVCELAETSRELFADGEFNDMLAMRLRRVGADARWLALGRREALSSGAGEPILRALAELDTEWLQGNIRAIACAKPDRWQELLAISPRITGCSPEQMAGWLVAGGAVTREQLLPHVKKHHPEWRRDVVKALAA